MMNLKIPTISSLSIIIFIYFAICLLTVSAYGGGGGKLFRKVPNYAKARFPDEKDYMLFLERFPAYAEAVWHGNYLNDPNLGYFGTGNHDHNEMRVLSNCIFVYALLATDKNYDETVSGIPQSTLLSHALAAIRFFTATHVTGEKVCTDGSKWGKQPKQWISPWVISKAVAGARLIWDKLTEQEKNALKRVITFEANYQANHKAFSRAYKGDSHSELNALNSEVLAWAASIYPDHPDRRKWLSKAREFFMNTLSTPDDANDTTIVDGDMVKDWVYTTNVHPDYTIEGHGAYQFDYNACPLHSLAWAYYAFESNQKPVPSSLFHHFQDVWTTLKRTFLYQGRFACPQGKDWARHVYGTYFIMPALVLLENEFNDADARLVERLRFRAFEWEQRQHGNGGVFSGRFGYQKVGWPLRYDTDCYANMGLAYLLHKYAPEIQAETPENFQRKVKGAFLSEQCDFMFSRNDTLFVSFSWRSLFEQYPMGLFIPGDDYMVEWNKTNLVGHLTVENHDMKKSQIVHNDTLLENGFMTTGELLIGERGGTYGVQRYISFTGLPEKGVALVIDLSFAKKEIRVTEQAGLSYYLPNDIFNGNERLIYWQNGEKRLIGVGGRNEELILKKKWLNVDDKLGIISVLDNHKFTIRNRSKRHGWYGELFEIIDYPFVKEAKSYKPGEVIQKLCFVLVSGTRHATEEVSKNVFWLDTKDELIKAVLFSSGDSENLIVANFKKEPKKVKIEVGDGRRFSLYVDALSTVLLPVSETSVELQDKSITTFGKLKGNVLFQNYPNPFNLETWIPYQLAAPVDVTVRIYSATGSLVRTFRLGDKASGSYITKTDAVHWDGKNQKGEKVASGVYFYTLKAGDFVATKRAFLVK